MITDKIKNLGNYTQLAKVKSFLDSHPEPLENGKYIIDDSCFVNVMEYETRDDGGLYEGHEKYIDLQMLISGEECVRVQNIADCTITVAYDPEKDAAFYSSEKYMNYYLNGSNFILLEPEDLHNPCLKVNGRSVKVKKYVFKILAQ